MPVFFLNIIPQHPPTLPPTPTPTPLPCFLLHPCKTLYLNVSRGTRQPAGGVLVTFSVESLVGINLSGETCFLVNVNFASYFSLPHAFPWNDNS